MNTITTDTIKAGDTVFLEIAGLGGRYARRVSKVTAKTITIKEDDKSKQFRARGGVFWNDFFYLTAGGHSEFAD